MEATKDKMELFLDCYILDIYIIHCKALIIEQTYKKARKIAVRLEIS